MNIELKKSLLWSLVLVFLGMLILYRGPELSLALIPVAVAIWYVAKPKLRTSRR